jgi:hypothetical protein
MGKKYEWRPVCFASLSTTFNLAIFAATMLTGGSDAMAFGLSPQGTKLEQVTAVQRQPWYLGWLQKTVEGSVGHFTTPVHEEVTHRIYECDADGAYCAKVDIEFAPPAVLYGVRWNDDPPFSFESGHRQVDGCKMQESVRFISQPLCWKNLFKDAEKGAAQGSVYSAKSGHVLLYRVHFGDLQFLHSMGSADGELSESTRSKIMVWAEFTWRVGSGEYGLLTLLRDVKIDGFNDLVGRPGWRVQDLLTYAAPGAIRQQIRQVAFGSLLHVMEDSFAKGHTDRAEPGYQQRCANPGATEHLAPGAIKEFHAYNNQNHTEHSKFDDREMLMSHVANTKPHVITVGRTLKKYFEDGATWDTVKPYMECVFALQQSGTAASAGIGFEK